jgi:eukaryotic-like serine/threonine-protein kinase
MPIDARRWAQVSTHFADLMASAPSEQTAALRRITDPEIRDEVASLLRAHASVGMRFESAPPIGHEPPSELPPPPASGQRIGAWQLVRLLGEGGMGAVYEAVRSDSGFSKRAAIKMVSRGTADHTLIPRFEAERRILARLEHRNIAALLDGGVDAESRPWFAMEFVEGERIDHWCTSHQLDVRARVQLFRQACGAVQYAHERLVVHRDIKPANMLVAADGTLKLLDFGIAKLANDTEAPVTELGAAPMTAAYASPEQRAGKPVTTATDIYSLGVVLYELLTGVRPTTTATADDTPPLPSRRLLNAADSVSAATGDTAARRRASKLLHGELDAIVMMALRPEPDRRYTSAEELGRDLQRWLDGRTVRARPDTVGYRTRSFVRRNRAAVAGVSVALLALIGGTVVSVRQARVARQERDRARTEQLRTQRVAEFFQQVFAQAAPREGGRQLTVTDALNRAIPIIDTAFQREPDLKAAVQLSIGSTLQNLEQSEAARPLLHAAYAYFRRTDGARPSRNQTDALWDLATLATRDGRVAEAESMYVTLAGLYRANPEYGPNEALGSLYRIAGLRIDAGDLRGAVAAYDSLLPRSIVVTRADSLDFANRVGARGVALATLGRFDRAVDDFASALAIVDRILGPDSFNAGQLLQPYAGAMLFTGRLARADSLARRGLALSRRAFGDDAASTLSAQRMLGTIAIAADRCRDAIGIFSEILSHRGPKVPDTEPSIGYALVHRGFCRARSGDVTGGVRDAREGLRLTRDVFGETHYIYHLAQSLTGAAIGYGPPAGHAEAERLLRDGANGLRQTLDAAHPRIRDADARLVEFQRVVQRGPRRPGS